MFKTENEILTTILLGVLLCTTLTVIAIWAILNYKKRQQKHFLEIETMNEAFEKQLMRSQIEVQEATLSVLGKELHDNIGQLLSSTKMLLGVTERKLVNPPDTLLIADETLGKAINELRSLSKSLDKEWLEQFNFIDNLTAEVSRVNASGDLSISFSHPVFLPLNAEKQIILFRIVQEAMQNALKHAQAKSIQVTVVEMLDTLVIRITDNGKGFNISDNKFNGVGINNIRNRTALLGGSVQWKSSIDEGTTILIQLPV